MKLYKRLGAFSYTFQTAMFLSLDYLYVPARNIEASLRYYTGKLGDELVWKIHALNTWVAASACPKRVRCFCLPIIFTATRPF